MGTDFITAATGLPSVEELALAIHRSSDMLPGESPCECGIDDVQEVGEWDVRLREASAALALFEAAVPRIKAEAVAEYVRYQTAEAPEGWRQ